MSDADKVLLGMVIVAGALFAVMASCLGGVMFIYRGEVDWKYVLFGYRASPTGETESAKEKPNA